MKRSQLIAGAVAVTLMVGAGIFVASRDTSKSAGTKAPRAVAATTPKRAQDAVARDKARLDHLAGQPEGAEALRGAWDATSDRVERVRILQAAAKAPDPKALAFLADIAGSDDALAAQAGAAIGDMHNPALADALVKLAASDAKVLVRANAARALTHSGRQQQAGALSTLVADASAPPRVRQEAALAVARIGDDAAAGVLGQALDALATDAASEQLRISIVQALGMIDSVTARDALVRHRARKLSSLELAFVARALARKSA